jgi:hypothetical protein
MNDQRPGLAKPVLISGVIFGIVAGIPFVGALNCLCCSWVIIAGIVSAYLYSRASKTAGTIFGPGEGALTGVLTGLVYAPVNTVMFALVNVATGMLERQLSRAAQAADPNARQVIERIADAGFVVVLGYLLLTLVLGALFGALGGLIGGLIFRYTPPAEDQQPPMGTYTTPPAGGQEPPGSAPPPPPSDDKPL